MKTENKSETKTETPKEPEPTAAETPIETSAPEPNQLLEMTELLKRTQANFENYRKQNEKRMEEFQQFANKSLLLQMLPLVDNFELALKTSCASVEDLRKGIEIIYSQFYNFLEENGIKPIAEEKQKFDPNYHEALMKADSELPENMIIEVLQKGFTLNDKVIRHAKVKVSTGIKPKAVHCNVK